MYVSQHPDLFNNIHLLLFKDNNCYLRGDFMSLFNYILEFLNKTNKCYYIKTFLKLHKKDDPNRTY